MLQSDAHLRCMARLSRARSLRNHCLLRDFPQAPHRSPPARLPIFTLIQQVIGHVSKTLDPTRTSKQAVAEAAKTALVSA